MIDLGVLGNVNYYQACRIPDSKDIIVTYDEPDAIDDEHYYTFKSDGSANGQCTWGAFPKMPAGTFSDLLLKLPKTGEINQQLAQELATSYQAKLDEIRNQAN